jgi:hypothetical protein
MGADLIVAGFAIDRDKPAMTKERIRTRVNKWLDENKDTFDFQAYSQEANGYSEEAEFVDVEQVRKEIQETLCEAVELSTSPTERGITYFDSAATAVRVYLAGGMSWGDDPSDAFTVITRIDDLGMGGVPAWSLLEWLPISSVIGLPVQNEEENDG